MIVDLALSGRELAYLLGCVGGMLLQPGLPPEHRLVLAALRDRLAPLVALDDELRALLGVYLRAPIQ